ncbi:30S ribosomal protein S5 [Candidatus Roizmanbacteria bacterium CG_4_10_14_0_2_um_filter_36_9]|uniref:Small ribosomal subunit protein uS5 n=1 Tax=Candidatus Roizmanbacteria bacterium CG_4_10_14_0_2_um_filter_36_9 TaxID=1974823 RepID=A0A2M7U375_9BACT|nr:MAG: 30S ribosomal protein S5 [Candidatus Roizmanbacteria bacterium CG_4_10_14_0_2_um_filter_36_9]
MAYRKNNTREENPYDERVVFIRRISKKTTGGNYITFSALVVVGDRKGKVGIGLGRGREVPPAIQKGITQAKRNMIQFPLYNETLPHEIKIKYKSSRLILKPAPPGTGLKVGGVVRAVLDVAGVNNASGKIIGTRNQITNAYAIMEAIKQLKPRIVKETVKKEKKVEVKAKDEKVSRKIVDKTEPVKKDVVKKKVEKAIKSSKDVKVKAISKKTSVKKNIKVKVVKKPKTSKKA